MAASYKSIRVWNSDSGELVALLRGHREAAYGLRWFPDHNRLVSVSDDETLRTWDVAAGICLGVTAVGAGQLWCIEWLQPGAIALIGARGGQLIQWNAVTESIAVVHKARTPIWSIHISPETNEVLLGLDSGAIEVLSTVTFKKSREMNAHSEAVTTLSANAERTRLYSLGEDSGLRVWTLPSLELSSNVGPLAPRQRRTQAMACCPTRPIVAVPGPLDGVVTLWRECDVSMTNRGGD